MRQIFIGGTGRSGTTIMSKILGLHSEIYRYPFETRFMIDPHGLIDLVPALSDQWSPWKADRAIRDFEEMMWEVYPPAIRGTFRRIGGHILTKLGTSLPRYALWISYRDIMPRKVFTKELDEFTGKIVDREFKGFWIGSGLHLSPKVYVARSFKREEIARISGDFVNGISSYPVKKAGKKMWLDHTPFNILHASFLHEMFPEMKLIHIYRDPRDVISSYKTKSWGGNSAHDNAVWIRNILEKWEDEKKSLPDGTYYEVRMEAAIKSPEKELRKICDFLGVGFEKKMMNIDLSKGHVGRWKKDLKPDEIKVANEVLGETLERYGYSRT